MPFPVVFENNHLACIYCIVSPTLNTLVNVKINQFFKKNANMFLSLIRKLVFMELDAQRITRYEDGTCFRHVIRQCDRKHYE